MSDAVPNLAESQSADTAAPVSAARATIRGIVKNAATGEPLPRALVRIEGNATTGALTDGDGRFEIPNVPVGPQAIELQKPGFHDLTRANGYELMGAILSAFSNHNVQVTPDMPDLSFAMAPTNSIRGQIQLSSGDPAQNITVMLLRRGVQDGRGVWQITGSTRTNSEGVYRFAGLFDGSYVVYTEPAMDTDGVTDLIEFADGKQINRSGYPSTFYPDARELNNAAKIQLSQGQQAQANISLVLEPFESVVGTVAVPGRSSRTPAGGFFSLSALDSKGHTLSYNIHTDGASGKFQGFLPDGAYILYATPGVVAQHSSFSDVRSVATYSGQTEVSVAGRPVDNLRIPLAPVINNQLQVVVARDPQAAVPGSGQGSISVTVSQAGGAGSDGMTSNYAQGSPGGTLPTQFMGPGPYWVHTAISQPGLCEASFTAGGASLAREPLEITTSGTTAPLTLTLRADCASLKISLPGNANVSLAGEEPFYTVYVVPDFDSTVEATPITLRPSSRGTFTLQNLTPGNYTVYTFPSPVDLEYRNPDVLASLSVPAQHISLSPGGQENLVVEVPAR